MKKPTERIIDINEKPKILFMIPKNRNCFYVYTNHWTIYDSRKVWAITSVDHKWKKYSYTYSFGRTKWGVMLYDIPVVDKVDRKINKNTWEVLEYNRDNND